MSEFNERFRAFRAALVSEKTGKKVTLKEMSEVIGIPLSSISKYEQGIIKPGVEILQKIGKKYGVNLNWLVFEEGGIFVAEDKNLEAVKISIKNALEMSTLANTELARVARIVVPDEK